MTGAGKSTIAVPQGWVTNDPEVAKTLRAIDRAYLRDRRKAENWALPEKSSWMRKCADRRDASYARVMARLKIIPANEDPRILPAGANYTLED